MTIPPQIRNATRRVTDMVRDMMPMRRASISPEERLVAVYLRGNDNLYKGLMGMIKDRINRRASLPEPDDPLLCKSMMARDRELFWVLSRLEAIYRSPLQEPDNARSEPPS